jgi:hypothetical protein
LIWIALPINCSGRAEEEIIFPKPQREAVHQQHLHSFQARFQLHVHLQDVFLNPRTDGLMQLADNFRTKPLMTVALLELLEKLYELRVRLLVPLMDGATMTFHAILFKMEMFFRVGFEKSHQPNQKFALLPRRVGFIHQALQLIDVVNQHLMLPVNFIGTGFKFIVPDNHKLRCSKNDLPDVRSRWADETKQLFKSQIFQS